MVRCWFSLYYSYCFHTKYFIKGTTNHIKDVDTRLWMTLMVARSSPVQPYDDDFYLNCHRVVRNRFGIDIGNAITARNGVFVYKHLVDNVN